MVSRVGSADLLEVQGEGVAPELFRAFVFFVVLENDQDTPVDSLLVSGVVACFCSDIGFTDLAMLVDDLDEEHSPLPENGVPFARLYPRPDVANGDLAASQGPAVLAVGDGGELGVSLGLGLLHLDYGGVEDRLVLGGVSAGHGHAEDQSSGSDGGDDVRVPAFHGVLLVVPGCGCV